MKTSVVFVAIVATILAVAAADSCFFAIDNVDTCFVKFDLEKGNVTLLGQLPDNPTLRTSAVYNPTFDAYHIVSQWANETGAGPKTLFTVDMNAGNVLAHIPFGNDTNAPSNLVWVTRTKTLYATYIPSQKPATANVVDIDPSTGAVSPVSDDLLFSGACTLNLLNNAAVDVAQEHFYVPIICGTSYYIADADLRTGAVRRWHIADAPLTITSIIIVEPSTGALLVEVTNSSSFDQTLLRVVLCGSGPEPCPNTVASLGAFAYTWYADFTATPATYYRGTQVPFTHPERFELYSLVDGKGPRFYSLNSFGLVFAVAPTTC